MMKISEAIEELEQFVYREKIDTGNFNKLWLIKFINLLKELERGQNETITNKKREI